MSDIVSISQDYLSRKLDNSDLSIRQFAMLGLVCDTPGPHHVRSVAEKIGVSKPVITRCVNRFQSLGLVIRVKDKLDARNCIIQPTEKGYAFRKSLK